MESKILKEAFCGGETVLAKPKGMTSIEQNRVFSFMEQLERHTENLKDARYKAIECLIASVMLTTGAKIWDIELVEKQTGDEVSWFVRRKV